MNRIILIGNGFDLAHGLKSKYTDFINYLWKTEVDKLNQCLVTNGERRYAGDYFNLSLTNSKIVYKKIDYTDFKSFFDTIHMSNYNFTRKNNFLFKISDKSVENWVDIEFEYFLELMHIIKKTTNPANTIKTLNIEFCAIKVELEKYLKSIIDEKNYIFGKKPSIREHLESHFVKRDFSIKGRTELFNHIRGQLKTLISEEIVGRRHNEITDILIEKKSLLLIQMAHTHWMRFNLKISSMITIT